MNGMIEIPAAEVEALRDALAHYMHAFRDPRDAWGAGQARALHESLPEHARLWMSLWYGQNHQNIHVGDTVRMQDFDCTGYEFLEVQVLAVSTWSALVNTPDEATWVVWPLLHRFDRLHTEPDFEPTHWVPIQLHMGREVSDSDIAEYQAVLDGAAHVTVAEPFPGRFRIETKRGEPDD